MGACLGTRGVINTNKHNAYPQQHVSKNIATNTHVVTAKISSSNTKADTNVDESNLDSNSGGEMSHDNLQLTSRKQKIMPPTPCLANELLVDIPPMQEVEQCNIAEQSVPQMEVIHEAEGQPISSQESSNQHSTESQTAYVNRNLIQQEESLLQGFLLTTATEKDIFKNYQFAEHHIYKLRYGDLSSCTSIYLDGYGHRTYSTRPNLEKQLESGISEKDLVKSHGHAATNLLRFGNLSSLASITVDQSGHRYYKGNNQSADSEKTSIAGHSVKEGGDSYLQELAKDACNSGTAPSNLVFKLSEQIESPLKMDDNFGSVCEDVSNESTIENHPLGKVQVAQDWLTEAPVMIMMEDLNEHNDDDIVEVHYPEHETILQPDLVHILEEYVPDIENNEPLNSKAAEDILESDLVHISKEDTMEHFESKQESLSNVSYSNEYCKETEKTTPETLV